MDSAYIRKLLRLLTTGTLAVLAAGSCVREDPEFDFPEEGRPSTVRLQWSTSDMSIQSRALTDEQERSVHSLWIGIYDYNSGKLKSVTDNKGATHDKGYYITPDIALGHHELDPQQALQLHTTSGESRIVAVANPDTNYGVSDRLEGNTTTPLLDLLRQCDTWEKFRSVATLTESISIEGGTTPNITLTEGNMPMTGVYYETLDHNTGASDPVDWTAEEANHTYIPAGATTLPGTIHLRRLHAYVDFRIVPGPHISVEPISWQIHNVPYASYLHERAQAAPEGCNAGDNDALGRLLGGEDYRGNYASSRLAHTFEKADDLGANRNRSGFRFDFYQFENKRTGLDHVTTYNEREEEYKTDTGTNTGIYRSLSDAAGGKNNMASYVEFRAKVTYYLAADGTTIVDPASATDEGVTPRLGIATYIVHLGYCEGRGAEKARDFNCRRNTRYTYTVEINGLNQIKVEAENGTETAGAEGDVIDYDYDSFIDLDCHYAVFNISMSDNERNRLFWRLRAPYDDAEGTRIRSYDQPTEDRDDPFYNWIRFLPANSRTELADYPANGTGLWTLKDMQDVTNHPHTSPQGNSDRQRWYTVFVDEYAYLLDRNGARLDAAHWKESAWERYVNMPDRTVWLIVDEDNYHLSPDQESLYTKTKFLISQRSIQTYYSTEYFNGTRTALGIEHMNETYGKNLTWNWERTDNFSNSNGRWNTWQYINSGSGRDKWATHMNTTKSDDTYPVPALQPTTQEKHTVYSPAPTGTYYEIVAACMSRNRDLNGNGTIDANELKWYLPAEGKYERIMLGRNALKSWLFDPTNPPYYTISDDPYAQKMNLNFKLISIEGREGSNGRPCWVHYASSDKRKFYPDEGGSYNKNLEVAWDYDTPAEVYGFWPWNIRCIRNLGVSFETVTQKPQDDPVERAYTFEAKEREENGNKIAGGIFDASTYNDDCLRGNVDTYLPVHPISDFKRNLIARTFEVAGKDATTTIGTGQTMEELMNRNVPCATHIDYDGDPGGWRIPNQRELMMILNESEERSKNKLTPILSNYDTRFSCTKEAYGNMRRFSAITTTTVMCEVPTDRFTVRCVRDVNPTRQNR